MFNVIKKIISSLIPFVSVSIDGDSMYPTLIHGQNIIATTLFCKRKCKIGRVYIVHLRDEYNEPFYVVKRLYATAKDGKKVMYDFRGDNAEVSYDSRQYGLVPCDKVVAKVIKKYPIKKGE